MTVFNFNLYNLKPMYVCIDSSQFTFTNAPDTMSGTFIFTVIPAFLANKLQQLVMMDSGNIVYTREYDGETSTFSSWITNGGGTGSITSVFGRTGPAITAQTGDYTVSQVTGAAPLAGPIFTGAPQAPEFALYNNTNQLTFGSSLTTTFTMASLTAFRFFTLPDANSNPVQPSTAPSNQFANGIDSSGVVQYAQPSPANFGYTVVHETNNYQFLASNIMVIMDADAKTGTLPDATTVVPGAVTYVLKLGVGATTGTLAVPVGQNLNDVLNGTFPLSGTENAASARSDGANWYTV